MPEPGREAKTRTEIDSSISQGWELPSHAGMCAMQVSMETQHTMYCHRAAPGMQSGLQGDLCSHSRAMVWVVGQRGHVNCFRMSSKCSWGCSGCPAAFAAALEGGDCKGFFSWGVLGNCRGVPWGSSRAVRASFEKWRETLTHPWGSQALAKIGMELRQPL